jgi:hypothetical protein
MGTTETVTVRIPLRFRKIGGRKLIISPDGQTQTPSSPVRIDNALIKALARARCWQRKLDDGTYATVAELAKGEKMAISYASRVLRLGLLGPDVVQAILDGTQPRELQLETLLRPWPLEWEEQRRALGFVR